MTGERKLRVRSSAWANTSHHRMSLKLCYGAGEAVSLYADMGNAVTKQEEEFRSTGSFLCDNSRSLLVMTSLISSTAFDLC